MDFQYWIGRKRWWYSDNQCKWTVRMNFLGKTQFDFLYKLYHPPLLQNPHLLQSLHCYSHHYSGKDSLYPQRRYSFHYTRQVSCSHLQWSFFLPVVTASNEFIDKLFSWFWILDDTPDRKLKDWPVMQVGTSRVFVTMTLPAFPVIVVITGKILRPPPRHIFCDTKTFPPRIVSPPQR